MSQDGGSEPRTILSKQCPQVEISKVPLPGADPSVFSYDLGKDRGSEHCPNLEKQGRGSLWQTRLQD